MPLAPHEFERLCKESRRAVLSYAYHCSRDWDVAEDIVQETLTIAFEKRDQYFAEANFGGWLISIARNVWFRERERRRLKSPLTSFIDENAASLFDETAYLEPAWTRESRALQGCLKKLNATDQDLIRAHFSEKKKYAEIAESRERTVSWVKVRMHRARMALLDCVRVTLSAEGGKIS
jgi:RNA polymerase sigma-70 factor (ECF subfamily)